MRKPNSRVSELKQGLRAQVANYKGNSRPTSDSYVLGGMAGAAPVAVEMENTLKSIGVTITNTDEVNALYAPLFGSFEAYPTPYNGVVDYAGVASGTSKGIIIAPRRLTTAQFRNYFNLTPGVITSVNYRFGDATQLEQEWVLRKSNGNDQNISTFDPQDSLDLKQTQDGILTTRGFVDQITEYSTIFVKIAKAPSSSVSRSVSLSFYIGQQVDQSNLALGKTPIRVYQQSTLSNF